MYSDLVSWNPHNHHPALFPLNTLKCNPTRSNKWVQQGRTHSAETKDDKFDTCWRIGVDSFFETIFEGPDGPDDQPTFRASLRTFRGRLFFEGQKNGPSAVRFDHEAMNRFFFEEGFQTTLRGKWLMDGATSFEEAALRLEEEAARLRRMEADGWSVDIIDDDYGMCSRQPKYHDTDN